MKNIKKLYFIFVFLITLFSFNLRVDAAQELTCLYKKEWVNDKILLIQYGDGSRLIYTNENNAFLEDDGWFKTSYNTDNFDDDIILENGDLTSCPKYVNTEGTSNFRFWDEIKWYEITEWFGVGLDESSSLNYVKEPLYVSVVKPNLTVEQSCSDESWLYELDTNNYSGACLYKGYNSDNTCNLIQVNFGLSTIQVTEYDQEKGFEYSGIPSFDGGISAPTTTFGVNFGVRDFLEFDGDCIDAVRVTRNSGTDSVMGTLYVHNEVDLESRNGYTYYLVNKKGNNPFTGEELSMDANVDILIDRVSVNSCADLFGEEIAGFLSWGWNFIKIFIPIILLVLGGLDFAKAVFAGKDDDMKKAQSKFIKRVIIAVVIFMIPVILSLLLKIASGIWGNIGADICGILL